MVTPLYLFKPQLAGTVLYVKLVLRNGCVVVSFHEDERFGLTQADLARLLRLGANTVSRWESGRNVETAAMDMLLRLIRDLQGSLDCLRDYHAVDARPSPDPSDLLQVLR